MANQPAYKIGRWTFIPSHNQLLAGADKIRLENRASRVLEVLCQKSPQVVSKEDLIEKVWEGRHLSQQSVPVVISNLRKLLEKEDADKGLIETIPKKGYRIPKTKPIFPDRKRKKQNLLLIVTALVVAVVLGFYLLPGQQSEARKPGVILTLNDIQNATGDEALMGQAVAMSEAGSHYLSQAGGILLIRHWWNKAADDPTGGIYDRYGEDAPIYHLSGTLIGEGGNLRVTLFLNDPGTDEVLWSEAYPVTKTEFIDIHLSNLGKILAFLGLEENIRPPGDEIYSDTAGGYYWLGLYLWHLGTEGGAKTAFEMWQKALQEAPDFAAAQMGINALKARWPDLFPDSEPPKIPDRLGQNASTLVQAGQIALYSGEDPESAARFARKALEISPNDYAAYALLAEALVREGEVNEALKAIREARLLAPSSTVYPEREAEYSELLEGGD